MLDGRVLKVIKFLKVVVIYASNASYFNSIEVSDARITSLQRIVELYKYYKASTNFQMLEEIMGLLITLSTRQNEKRATT